MAGRSRYDGVPTATAVVDDGAGGEREVAYLTQRSTPDPASTTAMARHRVRADDRTDLLADRYLVDPQAWWRICDANAALDPDALVGPDGEGLVVVIPVPQA